MGRLLTIADGDEFFALPAVGEFAEYLDGGGTYGKVYRKDFDTITIETKLGQTTRRSGYEKQLKITVPGFDRAHALGKIVGHESPHGIYPTPRSVNLQIQAHGIESFVGAMGKNLRTGQELYITVTVVRESIPHKVGGEVMTVDFLKEITYTVHTQSGQTGTRIFEAGFEIANPNKLKSRVNFSSPYISSEFNKFCDLDAVLASTQKFGITRSAKAGLATAHVPAKKRIATTAGKAVTAKAGSTPTVPKATASYRGTSQRVTSASQRGLTGRLGSKAGKLVGTIGKFYSYAGRTVIRKLPTILKAVSIVSMISSLYSLLDALNAALKTLAYGTPIPEFEKELGSLTSVLRQANRSVTEVYEENVLQEDHPAIEEALYNSGDKEGLDEIVDALMEDYAALDETRENLVESHRYIVQLQKDMRKSSDAHLANYNQLGVDSAGMAFSLMMWDALSRNANGLTTTIDETRVSIETLEGLMHDYNELIDFYNGSSWALQILRNCDQAGLDPPAKAVMPTESVWGPNAR